MPAEHTKNNNGGDKSCLRRQKLMLRKSLEEAELLKLSENIIKHIKSLFAYKNAHTVYFYMAAGNEINLTPLFEESLKAGKRCVFPRVVNDSRMDFFAIYDVKELKEGYRGIREPDWNCPVYRPEGESSIMLVPGVVFDRRGGRIGMGKGFYDRYIYSHRPDCLLGVCGEYQLVDKAPMNENDIFMDMVVTEKGVYNGKL